MAAAAPSSPRSPTNNTTTTSQSQRSENENTPQEQSKVPSIPVTMLKDPPPQSTVDAPKKDPPSPPTAALLKDPPSSQASPITTTLKDPPPPSASNDTTKKSSPPPSYENTKTSPPYLLAKSQLSSGDFETALTTISTHLTTLLSIVSSDIHPSLAPLYYLYGTTLLYSVEESTNPDEAMLQSQHQQQSEDDDNNEEVNDLQIAWENLESARNILAGMELSSDDMRLDVAQIRMRLGDLQKINGNYADSVRDYKECLEMRMGVLGEFDRSVADCHYNLGMAYLMLAAGLEETNGGGGDDGDDDGKASAVAMSAEGRKMEYKRKSMDHYLRCGRGFAGLIAKLCSVDPHSIVGDMPENDDDKKPSSNPTDDDDTLTPSNQLSQIRQRVSTLKATDVEDEPKVHDWRELLDEIQETIDSSEESVKVLEDVSKLKAQAEAQIEASDKEALTKGLQASMMETAATGKKSATISSDGPVTTVGFGDVTMAASCTTTMAGAAASSSGVVNMMVPKKKKKRAALLQDATSEGGDCGTAAKRVKTDVEGKPFKTAE